VGLSDNAWNSLYLLGALLIFLGLLGIMAFFAFIGIRSEMLLYARTINGIRAYFEDHNKELHDYLVLPRDEYLPAYFEGPRTSFFWETMLVGTINSIIIAAGTLLLFSIPISPTWGDWLVVLAVGGTAAHAIAYWEFTRLRDSGFKPHFASADAPAGPRSLQSDSRGGNP
jgi:hypothetical protein